MDLGIVKRKLKKIPFRAHSSVEGEDGDAYRAEVIKRMQFEEESDWKFLSVFTALICAIRLEVRLAATREAVACGREP